MIKNVFLYVYCKLGKTLQIITLVHTLLAHHDLTKVNRVLILVPVNVLQNWMNEFKKWTKHSEYKIKFDSLYSKQSRELRFDKIENWFDRGGVLICGFNMFVGLVKGSFFVGMVEKKKF